jgi:hypothetical protein
LLFRYTGIPRKRTALAMLRNKKLSIYVQKEDARSQRALMDLATDICEMFSISPDRYFLVHYILSSEETAQDIEKTLEERGIPALSTLPDDLAPCKLPFSGMDLRSFRY